MKVPPEHWTNCIEDADVYFFLSEMFNEPEGGKLLEIGSHDESAEATQIFTKLGYKVIAVDLREPSDDRAGIDYQYLRHDFCDLPLDFIKEHAGTFDAAYSISALEHFGLGTYREGPMNWYYDVIACRQTWQLLKEGGSFYVTVPYGRTFLDLVPYWRVYDEKALQQRIVQDFTVLSYGFFFSAWCEDNGKLLQKGHAYTKAEADQYPGHPPHCTSIVRMKKISKNRLAPDGR